MVDRKAEIEFAKLNARHKARRSALGRAIGMNPSAQQEMEDTYAADIRDGTSRYIPKSGEEGVFGELHTTVIQDGKSVEIVKKITNSAQAGYLIGLQGEVDSKKK